MLAGRDAVTVFDVQHLDDVAPSSVYPAASTVIAEGGITGRLLSANDFPLWLVVSDIEPGALLRWGEGHGDEAVFVLEGELETDDGRRCPVNGTVVVESDASAAVVAREASRVVHMGPRDPTVPTDGLNGPPEGDGHGVHVVGPGGTYAVTDEERDTHYYADSTCPTCRLTLLYTSRSSAYRSDPHSHSQDELIYVLRGELRIGDRRIGPGSTLAIARDHRYGFRTDGPFAFINYRRDASEQTVARDEAPRMEGGLVNGLEPVMDLR